MNDRQLLEAAAKAAGLHLGAWRDELGAFLYRDARPGPGTWNPLTDDGDALQLAVKLGIKVMPYPVMSKDKHSVVASRRWWAGQDKDGPFCSGPEAVEVYGGDPDAATRRAIVRAAAALAG